MKKTIIFVAIGIILVLLFASPYIIDNTSTKNYKNDIEDKISGMENTSIEQIHSFCGNSAGTGNRTDMYVCVLVKTNLETDEIKGLLNDAAVISKIDNPETVTSTMDIVGIKFQNIEFDKSQNYYIAEYVKKAPCSGFDMRGY